ncbi:iron donor protein CyaY [Utexia brackfieldae]|uniref:iron donor protein CyaY n=1 Tax=Utexia brackfieldae TaxID=3074108 RepID=UPI00370D1B1F
MEQTQFHQLAEILMTQVESTIDQYVEQTDSDIDYEIQGNVMTITLENQHKIIINTQEPLRQMWMATRQQGYHFDYRNNHWYCNRNGAEFITVLKEALISQA